MNRKERRAAAVARRAELSNEENLFSSRYGMICPVCGQPCTAQFGGRLEGFNVPRGCEKCQPEWDKITSQFFNFSRPKS